MGLSTCSVTGCTNNANGARGWCNMHYQRWYHNGSPLTQKRIHGDDWNRFWSKVDKNGPVPAHRPELGPCWIWQGALGRFGYAQIRMGGRGGKMVLVHRWSYNELVGAIPTRRQLDHLCRVRHCVNPDHLEPVTARENTRRSFIARGISLKNAA